MLLDIPLSISEVRELEEFLASDAAPESCMDVATLHGFFTAIIVGPDPVLPSEWLPAVWGGGDGPEFKSEEEAQRIIRLIFRFFNDVSHTLQDTPHKFFPIVYDSQTPDGKPDVGPEEWCEGFGIGMEIRLDAWEPFLQNEETMLMLVPIIAFLDDEMMDGVLKGGKEMLQNRSQLVAIIPMSVVGLYFHLKSTREKMARKGLSIQSIPVGNTRKPGRNEPCPCGSGRKYKKCCGAARE